jgi:hypothetical protein
MLGLPHGAGLNDTPLAPLAFASTATVDYGRFFQPPPPPPATAQRSQTSTADADRLAQLRALGYIGSAEPSRVTPLAGP